MVPVLNRVEGGLLRFPDVAQFVGNIEQGSQTLFRTCIQKMCTT